jgi:hypothetical protein
MQRDSAMSRSTSSATESPNKNSEITKMLPVFTAIYTSEYRHTKFQSSVKTIVLMCCAYSCADAYSWTDGDEFVMFYQ